MITRQLAKLAALLVALLMGLGLLATPASAAPLSVEVRRGHVLVRAEPGLEDTAVRLANRAARDLARIGEDLPGLPSPPSVEIRLVDDTRDLQRVAPQGRAVPEWAVGVAFSGTSILAVATTRAGTPLDFTRTLTHELAHLALDAAIGTNAPRWLHEGFAYQHSADWSPERAETLFGMAWMGGAIPIRELEIGFPAEELPASRAYAESYDFVGFLAKRGRWADADDDGDRWPFRRFLRALAGSPEHPNVSVDEAALAAFGTTLDDLYLEWHADLRTRYMFLPAGVFAALIWLFATILLVLAWRRRRRQNRVRLARWASDEAAAEKRARAWEAMLARQRYEIEAQLDEYLDAVDDAARPLGSDGKPIRPDTDSEVDDVPPSLLN